MAPIYKRVLHQAVRQKWPRKSDQSTAWTDGLSPSGAAGVVAMMMDTRCWLWSWCWWWCRWISGQSATQTDGLSLVAGCLSYQTPCCKLRLLLPGTFYSSLLNFSFPSVSFHLARCRLSIAASTTCSTEAPASSPGSPASTPNSTIERSCRSLPKAQIIRSLIKGWERQNPFLLFRTFCFWLN